MEVCPSYAPALYNVAVVHAEAGRMEEAIAQYYAVFAISPTYPEAWCNLGVIYKNQVVVSALRRHSSLSHAVLVFAF